MEYPEVLPHSGSNDVYVLPELWIWRSDPAGALPEIDGGYSWVMYRPV